MNALDPATADLAADALPDETTSRHSIYEKVAPELRRKLDRAILTYEPAGYRPLYKKYNLADVGLSFTAFYRYASRLRARAAALQLAEDALPNDHASALADLLPALISQHLVEQIMAGDSSGADTIYKLILAHRAALENAAVTRRHRATQIRNSPSSAIPHSEFRIPHSPDPVQSPTPSNLCSSASSAEKADDLLARVDEELAAGQIALAAEKEALAAEQAALAEEKAALASDEARALAYFEQVKKDLTAMGYPVADCKTPDELEEILRTHNPVAAPVPAADEPPPSAADVAPVPSVPSVTSVPSPRGDSASQTSNPEISNPPALSPSLPHSEFPLPTSSAPSNLCSSASSAEKKSDAITSTADDQFRITPEERRLREFHRVAIAYGLIKPDTPVPILAESVVKPDCPTQ